MARATFRLEADQIYELQTAMQLYGVKSGRTVDEVLHNEGAEYIREEIMRLLPESGRKWKGKKTAAKRTNPFLQKNDSLAVTIHTKSAYHYLYFPDDGTNTTHHIGYKGKPREFMLKGAENQAARIMDLCVKRLIEKWEGG